MNAHDVVSEFHQAMSEAGLRTSARMVPDGKLRRFHVDGDRKGSENGWGVLFRNPPAGAFGCWRRGLDVKWSANGAAELPVAERERMEQMIHAARAA